MAKGTVPNRRYTHAFKRQALRLAKSAGINQEMPRFPSSIVHPDLEVGVANSIPKSDAKAWARMNNVNGLCLP
jgi:hypothetical protein